jgi:hypothetical protein
MLRCCTRFLHSAPRPLSAIAAAAAAAVPIGVDRKPFDDPSLVALLRAAPFKDLMWLTANQLHVFKAVPKAGSVPVVLHGINGHIVARFYNMEQLQNPMVIRRVRPQWIDGEPIFGVEALHLANRRQQVIPGQDKPSRWFSFPDGLTRLQLYPTPSAVLVNVVVGFKSDRRALSLINEVHATIVSPVKAVTLVPEPFHRSDRGVLFGTEVQFAGQTRNEACVSVDHMVPFACDGGYIAGRLQTHRRSTPSSLLWKQVQPGQRRLPRRC